MVIHRVNETELFKSENSVHFRIRDQMHTELFLQVYDFYELLLMTKGKLELTTGHDVREIHVGALVLLRPGDIHAKRNIQGAQHINIAFPKATVESLFKWLDKQEKLQRILSMEKTPMVQLSPGEALILKSRMFRLTTRPDSELQDTYAEFRCILFECITARFLPLFNRNNVSQYPEWLSKLLVQMDNPANLAKGMNYLEECSGKTTEHLCRSFKKYLNTTPNAYLNFKRMNYAANLLRCSDHSILDIAYESGFCSESSFYYNFTREYGISPGKFRKQHATNQHRGN